MSQCPYYYNMMLLNKYIQINNNMIFTNMMLSYNKKLCRDEIKQTTETSLENNSVNLVLDSQNNDNIPKNFRKSSTILNTQNNKDLNLIGLITLNISGSQQFSGNNLPILIKSINTSSPITIIDLRQESHGFINELPVSWANAKNDANIGLTKNQVMLDEYTKLSNIKLNVPLTFYNHKNITIIPTKVEDEDHLVNSKSLSYNRITVTDGKIPKDDMVDYFVNLVISQPKNSWFHFHCKQGIGRTTTFMIMYDMIKNSDKVTAGDIIERQLLLANFDESHIKSFNNNERINFLNEFYKYCKENSNEFY